MRHLFQFAPVSRWRGGAKSGASAQHCIVVDFMHNHVFLLVENMKATFIVGVVLLNQMLLSYS